MSYTVYKQVGVPALGYSEESGVKIIEQDGLPFKDLNKDGVLEPYEDWRLSPELRAEDLAARLSIRDIAGLMLYTSHLAIPSTGSRSQTYNGKAYEQSGAAPYTISDGVRDYLVKAGIKHTLVTSVESAEIAARWNNAVQELAEGMEWGIPVVHRPIRAIA